MRYHNSPSCRRYHHFPHHLHHPMQQFAGVISGITCLKMVVICRHNDDHHHHLPQRYPYYPRVCHQRHDYPCWYGVNARKGRCCWRFWGVGWGGVGWVGVGWGGPITFICTFTQTSCWCAFTHTPCYAIVRSCTSPHTSCYATLPWILLHFHTYIMLHACHLNKLGTLCGWKREAANFCKKDLNQQNGTVVAVKHTNFQFSGTLP